VCFIISLIRLREAFFKGRKRWVGKNNPGKSNVLAVGGLVPYV